MLTQPRADAYWLRHRYISRKKSDFYVVWNILNCKDKRELYLDPEVEKTQLVCSSKQRYLIWVDRLSSSPSEIEIPHSIISEIFTSVPFNNSSKTLWPRVLHLLKKATNLLLPQKNWKCCCMVLKAMGSMRDIFLKRFCLVVGSDVFVLFYFILFFSIGKVVYPTWHC